MTIRTPAKNPKIFAIGDIHGCVRELQVLLAHLPLAQDSVLVFLGDYIDRGNYSRQVVDAILSLKKQYTVITLKGNHEAMLLDFLRDPQSQQGGMFILNGGSSTLASYADENGDYSIPEDHMEFYRELEVFSATEDFFFVHAGVPNMPLSQIDPVKHQMIMLWIREPFLESAYDWGKLIVHGHSIVDKPEVFSNRMNIDTACVFNGKLTAVELPKRKFYSVSRNELDEPRVFLKDKGSNRVSVRFDGAIPVFVNRDGKLFDFETLNYSEFGLLLREAGKQQGTALAIGETVEGLIGNENHSRVSFRGVVVRREDRDTGPLYGIKMESVEPANEHLERSRSK